MKAKTDPAGKKLGMWLFLYTEIILFGGLFVLYAVYFVTYTEDFIAGARELDRVFGVVNTVILLVSSFCVAAAVTAVQQSHKGVALAGLGGALFCGAVFLVNKYIEWGINLSMASIRGRTGWWTARPVKICFSVCIMWSPGFTGFISLSA